MKIIQLNVRGFDNNFSYIIIGKDNKSILIDPTGEKSLIEKTIKENNLKIVLLLCTHSHPDHIELLDYFKQKNIPSKNFEQLKKEPVFFVNEIKIQTIFTPGHTKDSVCFLIEKNLFTGDTLFVKGVGTTAYGGNEKELEKTLKKLDSFVKKIIIWPGHNYNGSKTTLGEALLFAHKKPSAKVLEKIKKKVEMYEKEFLN